MQMVFARAARPDRPPEPYDDDDRQAALLTRGYRPGLVNELQQRLGDVETELQGEREKIEKGAKRAEHVRRAQEAGRLSGLAYLRAMDDLDEGDENRVRQLEHRAASLRARIADAMEAVSPPERQARGPVEQAALRAQQIAAAVAEERRLKDAADARARAQLRAERASFRRSHRPFAGGGGGDGTEHTGYAYR
jgi:hypothetical protein